MSTTIPQPDVEVTDASTGITDASTGITDASTGITGASGIDVTISRDGKARSYHGVGVAKNDAVKDAVKKILDDPHTAEYVRRG